MAARMDHHSLAWHKTEHAYPAHRTAAHGRAPAG